MRIIKIHYKMSKPVSKYREIEEQAEKMKHFIVTGPFEGHYNKAFALAHMQVSETPYSFFIVSPDVMVEKMFRAQVIINPKIIDAPLHKEFMAERIPNDIEYAEPCMSFPFRKPKRVIRYDKITVEYQVQGIFGLKKVRQELTEIASQIFQHMYDLTVGRNIFFESEEPRKWWELIGSPKSKGGTSMDEPEDLDISRTEEKATDCDNLKEYGKK